MKKRRKEKGQYLDLDLEGFLVIISGLDRVALLLPHFSKVEIVLSDVSVAHSVSRLVSVKWTKRRKTGERE